MDTRSSTTVHLLFGKQAHEKRILAALSRKGDIMKETTPDQALHGGGDPSTSKFREKKTRISFI
jgi:hypothetical protein